MRTAAFIGFIALAGCSTLQSRLEGPPDFSRTTQTSLAAFQKCFVAATANQNVAYLPTGNGGTFTASAGPQDYVFWAVTIDDLGNERRVTVHAVGSGKIVIREVESCLD
jgi:hypothetical protein